MKQRKNAIQPDKTEGHFVEERVIEYDEVKKKFIKTSKLL